MTFQLYRAKTTNENKYVYGYLIKKQSPYALSEYYIEDEEGMGHDVITETIQLLDFTIQDFNP